MTTHRSVSYGKPDAGNPHVWFDEGECSPATPRRGSLLCKKILSAAVVSLMALGVLADTWNDPQTGITWTYTISGGEASVENEWRTPAIPTSTSGEITIPSNLGGCPVTSIGSYGFWECRGLTSVTIPEGVTNIGICAFCNCPKVTSIRIPASVISIGDLAFSSEMLEFIVDEGNPVYKSENGLLINADKKMLVAGVNGDVIIPDGIVSVDARAFSGREGLTSIKIPQSVTNIGDNAFWYCHGLGNGVIVVDGCLLTVNGDCPSHVEIPDGTRLIAGGAFEWRETLESVSIPASVEHICENAFNGCSRLKSVDLPTGLKDIGELAFNSCSALMSIVIPAGVAHIPRQAFNGCVNLREVLLNEGLKSIGSVAFTGCCNLKSIKIPLTVTYMGVNK